MPLIFVHVIYVLVIIISIVFSVYFMFYKYICITLSIIWYKRVRLYFVFTTCFILELKMIVRKYILNLDYISIKYLLSLKLKYYMWKWDGSYGHKFSTVRSERQRWSCDACVPAVPLKFRGRVVAMTRWIFPISILNLWTTPPLIPLTFRLWEGGSVKGPV